MGKQPIESHTYSITETPEQLERHKVIIQTMEDNRANGLPANYNISRADWMSVTKFDISLDMWRGLFLQNQYAKGNAEATVTHYNSSFRKISRFMCWATTDEATYKSKSRNILAAACLLRHLKRKPLKQTSVNTWKRKNSVLRRLLRHTSEIGVLSSMK